MPLHHYFPSNRKALQEVLLENVKPSKCIVVQAGHFLLYFDEKTGQIVPCIQEELQEPHLANIGKSFGAFPLLTWLLGLDILAQSNCERRMVMTVVNDWQYVPSTANREAFYKDHNHLPSTYEAALKNYGPEIEVLQPKPVKTGIPTRPFFSEMNQRNQFRKRVEKMLRKDILPAFAEVDRTTDGVVCRVPHAGSFAGREFYCSGKSPDCAAQIAQMLSQAKELSDCDTFINIYPLVCRSYVEGGTILASQLFAPRIPCVINIGLPSSHVRSLAEALRQSEVAVHT